MNHAQLGGLASRPPGNREREPPFQSAPGCLSGEQR